MTIDETIKREKEIHKDNQMVVETHIVHEDFTLEELYCDDTEVIQEHLENYRFAPEYHKQIAEWLEELKSLKAENEELNNEEQAESVFIAERDAEIREKAIDEFAKRMSLEISESIIWDMLATMSKNCSLSDTSDKIVDYVIDNVKRIAVQMKGGGKDA